MTDRIDLEPRLVAASEPPPTRDAVRLLVLDRGAIAIHPFTDLPDLLSPGDLVVVNDAATWPASVHGRARGEVLELRLTAGVTGARARAVVFGAGDWRIRTEQRALPPVLRTGDRIDFAGGHVIVARVIHPRLVELEVPDRVALFRAGRAVQYAHVARPLEPWDVATTYAGRPWAAEMPSAGRPLSFALLARLSARGVAVAPLTHAAGLSSTGDAALDATLPWPERYEIPEATAQAIAKARRVVAVGTTVVRALESDPSAGTRTTDLVIGAAHRLRTVGAILSGLHDPPDSHFRLLEAFASRERLIAAWDRARAEGLRGHELGDAMLVIS